MRLRLVVGFLACLAAAPGALAQNGPVHEPGNGVSAPRVVHEVKPAYTPEAKEARIQGDVLLEAVVRPDGTITDVKVVRSLDAEKGLDREAVRALEQWRFEPGSKDGKPVAVRVKVEMTFRLK